MSAIYRRRTGRVLVLGLSLALGACGSSEPQPVGEMAAALPHCQGATADQVLRMDPASQLIWIDDEIDLCQKEPALKAQDYILRGTMLVELRGNGPELAIQDFSTAIELQPGNARAYAGRMMAKLALGRFADALPDANKTIELAPDAAAYSNRAQIYRALGDPEAAIADYTRSIELLPDRAGSYQGRGLLYGRIKEIDKALADLERSMQLDPARIVAWQEALANLKYYTGPQNGEFDPPTKSALRRWLADGMKGFAAEPTVGGE